ncbi:glycosyltransferase family 61 protein [Roseomonas mucosa]|uniref:glycosyltransferase family 61 protein n=1 Tax=Roseomonas mucosa TaxID=207340 RepID=UPI002240C0BD|nr:glycosyltransferase family 61 protein [Roseomonas mucosa]
MDLTDLARNSDTRATACHLLGRPNISDFMKEVEFLKLITDYHLRFIAPVDENGSEDEILGFHASTLPVEPGSERFRSVAIGTDEVVWPDMARNGSLSVFQLPSLCRKELLGQVLEKISELSRYSFFYVSLDATDPSADLFSRWLFSCTRLFRFGITELDGRRIFIGSVLAIGHKRDFQELASLPGDNLYPLVEVIPAEENKPDPEQALPDEIKYLRSTAEILHPAKSVRKPAYPGHISPLATSGPGKGLYVSSHQEQFINTPYLYEMKVKDALVHGNQLFFTAGNYLIGDSIGGQHLNPGLIRSGIRPLGRTQSYVIPQPSGNIHRHDELFLLGNRRTNGYYHWIVDVFPRFQYYRPSQGKYPFLAGAKASFAKAMLDLYGIDGRYEAPEADWHRVDTLRFISPPRRDSLVPLWNEGAPSEFVHSFYRGFLSELGISGKPERRIFLTRKRAPKRKVVNEAAVENILLRMGFEVVAAEDLSVPEQISMFANTAILIGPHGAGLANSVFMPEGAHVVEFMPDDYTFPFFQNLACVCKVKYSSILTPTLRQLPYKLGNEYDIYVDERALVDCLSKL